MTKPLEQVWIDGTIAENTWQDSPEKCVSPHGPYIRADLVPQWQPIETAPKDETIFATDGECSTVGYLCEYRGFAISHWAVFQEYGWYPTHWMPLPEPPKP